MVERGNLLDRDSLSRGSVNRRADDAVRPFADDFQHAVLVPNAESNPPTLPGIVDGGRLLLLLLLRSGSSFRHDCSVLSAHRCKVWPSAARRCWRPYLVHLSRYFVQSRARWPLRADCSAGHSRCADGHCLRDSIPGLRMHIRVSHEGILRDEGSHQMRLDKLGEAESTKRGRSGKAGGKAGTRFAASRSSNERALHNRDKAGGSSLSPRAGHSTLRRARTSRGPRASTSVRATRPSQTSQGRQRDTEKSSQSKYTRY